MEKRLDTLDAMRGLAAAAVVVHHAGTRTLGHMILPSAYLAVDFFFMLSGFVLAKTYESQFASGLSTPAFALLRLRRLWPTVACGIFLGWGVALLRGRNPDVLAIELFRELIFVPQLHYDTPLYVLDGVQWSLLFELVANLVHSSCLRRLGVRGLAIVSLLCLAWLGWFALRFDSVAVGDTGTSVTGGLPRVFFSYSAGILIYRLAGLSCLKGVQSSAALPLAALLAVLLGTSSLRSVTSGALLDILTVAIAFPAMLIAANHSSSFGPCRRAAAILGRLSYPLYAVHLPLVSLVIFEFGGGVWGLAWSCAAALGGAVLLGAALEPKHSAARLSGYLTYSSTARRITSGEVLK